VKKHRVKIHDDRFEPCNLKVERGETVEWTLHFKIESGSSLNHSKSRPHVVTFDNIHEESGLMRTITDTFKVKFSEVGAFTYKCSMHTRMLGKIEVVEAAKELNIHSIKSMQQLLKITPLTKQPISVVQESEPVN